MRTFKVTLLYLAAMFCASLLGAPAQSLDVYPRISQGPATIRMRATIEPHADNRHFCWGYDGPVSRESCEALDGDTAARTRTTYWKDLPGGRYVGFVAVWKVGQKSPDLVKTSFCVVSAISDPNQTTCGE